MNSTCEINNDFYTYKYFLQYRKLLTCFYLWLHQCIPVYCYIADGLFSFYLYDSSQGEKGDAGLEGAKGERGEIGLKGKEGPPGPPGLVGVRVSISAANSWFHSLPLKRQLSLPPYDLVRFSFTRVRTVNLAKSVKEESLEKRVVSSLCLGLKYTFHSWISLNLLSFGRAWMVLCCSDKQ